jgi:hypothetical protein
MISYLTCFSSPNGMVWSEEFSIQVIGFIHHENQEKIHVLICKLKKNKKCRFLFVLLFCISTFWSQLHMVEIPFFYYNKKSYPKKKQ